MIKFRPSFSPAPTFCIERCSEAAQMPHMQLAPFLLRDFLHPQPPVAGKWGTQSTMPTSSPVDSVVREKGEWQELMWKEPSHGLVGTGSSGRALAYTVSKSRSWPMMPCSLVKRKEHRPGRQDPGFSSTFDCDKTQTFWNLSFLMF